ncbi:MAG: ABC transporter ATP-binding protein [Eubacteriales bacterium]|nr:ABC transporter ATP-binding protein [Eubacteriales bacterium]
MKRKNKQAVFGLRSALTGTVRRAPLLALGLAAAIAGAVALGLLPPLALEGVVNDLTAGRAVTLRAAALYFALLALSGVFDSAKELAITVFGQRVTHALRSELCAKLSRLPAGYFGAHDTGSVASLFVGDVDTVESLFTNGVISMFADGCKVAGIVAVVFAKSRGLGLMLALVTPPLLALTRAFQKRMLAAQLDHRAAIARVNNHLPETLRSLRMIRSFSRQRYMERRYDGYLRESYRAVERSNLYDSIYSPIILFSGSCLIAAVMCLSAAGGDARRFFGMSAGTAVAVIAYIGKVFTPLEAIGMEIQNVQAAVASVRRVDDFLRVPDRPAQDISLACEALRAAGASIRFEHVRFGYDPAQPVLRDLSFAVAPGETVTLVGRTGAGKSTAFKLLLGLYAPDAGRVTAFGADAAAIPDREKRRLFGYVAQSFQLVPGTVADQITLFDPALTRADTEKAASLVGMDEAIRALESGYDTPCRATLFSQGQLQLLNIARAIVAGPAVLLLDEITANLDSATEQRVLEALQRACADRTVLSISHRLFEASGGRRIVIA